MFGFEKLNVWQESIKYVDDIYSTIRNFPADEQYGLTGQLKRAVVSIAINIAEGSGRESKREFVRFVNMAYGSLCETISLLKICLSREMLDKEPYERLYKDGEKIGRMLSGLKGSLKK